MKKDIAIGVDIGGSHISCAAIDLSNHQIIAGSRAEHPVDNHAQAADIIQGWAAALRKTMQTIDTQQLAGIGFAMPGPFDYVNGIALFEGNEKFEQLYNVNVSRALREELQLEPDTSLRYINDATSFAIAEAWIGKAKGYDKVLALTLGTGFGSAFLKKSAPVIEGPEVPKQGCVWHLPFKDGIADDYFSTRWFVRRYAEETGIAVAGVKEIAVQAASNAVAQQLFDEYGTNMGNCLSGWMKTFGVEVMVIGGNISGAIGLFGPALKSSLQQNGLQPDIYISELKEDAAIIGSARLIDESYWPSVKDLLSKM